MPKIGYYRALVEAVSFDGRPEMRDYVKDGKFTGWVLSPFWFRQPVLFYLWRLLAPDGSYIFYLALLLAVSLVILSYFSASYQFGLPGIFVSAMLVPYFFMSISWANVLMPDLWAGLAFLGGIFFYLMKKPLPASVCFLFAAFFREVLFAFLLIFLVAALVKKEQKERLFFLAAVFIFLGLYIVHYFTAAQYISAKSSALTTVMPKFNLVQLLTTSSFLMFPYGFFLFPAFVFIIIAFINWLRLKKWELMVLTALAVPYFATASQSYWGQHLLPFIIFSAFMLFSAQAKTAGQRRKI